MEGFEFNNEIDVEIISSIRISEWYTIRIYPFTILYKIIRNLSVMNFKVF